jgi:hypothetical protein
MSEYVKQNQMVHFSVVTHHPSSGLLTEPMDGLTYYVYKVNDGDGGVPSQIHRANMAYVNTALTPALFHGSFYTSGSIFPVNSYCEVYVSGRVEGLVDVAIVKTFTIAPTVDANVIQTSGNAISPFFGQDIYYANVKLVKDNINTRDEYNVNWFKNSLPVVSGQLTNPAITVYKTSDNTTLFANQTLTFANTILGVSRFNSASNIVVSGEVYLARVSGTIDGATREWQNLIGIDAL